MRQLSLCSVWLLSGCFIGKEVYERRMADFTDDDGDGYHEEDGDCNDLDPAFLPGAVDASVWYPNTDGDGPFL